MERLAVSMAKGEFTQPDIATEFLDELATQPERNSVMTVNRIRLEVQEFSDHIIQETKDIGDLGGSGQPDINASQQPFTL